MASTQFAIRKKEEKILPPPRFEPGTPDHNLNLTTQTARLLVPLQIIFIYKMIQARGHLVLPFKIQIIQKLAFIWESGDMYVTSFFSTSYYSNLRLISKTDLEVPLQPIVNQKSILYSNSPPPSLRCGSNIDFSISKEQINYPSDLVSKLVSNSTISICIMNF